MGCGISKAGPSIQKPINLTIDDNIGLDDEKPLVCLRVDDASGSSPIAAGTAPQSNIEASCKDVLITHGVLPPEAPGLALRSNFLEVNSFLRTCLNAQS